MKRKFKLAGLLFLGLILFVTCKKETPLPTASFTYSVTGNTVTFYAQVTNDSKYEWDFGDGSYINTIHSPVHAYSAYGVDYSVKLTIIGPGGSTTVSGKVTIPPKTKMQLLTGGLAGSTSSKKWRLSSSAPSFLITAATANFQPVVKDYPGSVLGAVGLAMVYTDEYIFKGDGNLTINSKGGGIMAGYVYCLATGTKIVPNPDAAGAGLAYAKPFVTPPGATFAINEGKNFTLTTTLDGKTPLTTTYPGVTTLSFTKGGFLGVMDFKSECIIQQLTDTKMVANVFVSTVYPGLIGTPNMALTLTFEVAP
ncbi:MAG: PKD domain-containing protein [Prolixibacteraceae bacterium]|nr:PKD domain-containing protein [Prolixibacteraceae bacterium]